MKPDSSIRNAFEREGFFVQRGLFSEEVVLLGALLDENRERTRALENVTIDSDGRGATNLGYLGHGDDLITCFVTSSRLVGLARKILDEEVYLLKARLNVKWGNEVPDRCGGWDPHQDRAAWAKEGLPGKSAVTVALAIDRCDARNGAMEFIPRSHENGILEHARLDSGYGIAKDTVEGLVEKHGMLRIDMDPGDALFFSGDTVHCSKPNESASRRGLLFITYNAVSNSPGDGVGPSRYRYVQPLPVSPDDELVDLVARYERGAYTPSLDYDAIDRVREIDIAEGLDSGWTELTPTLTRRFQPIPTSKSPATFLQRGEPVLERHWNRKRLQIFMPDGPKVYMRLQPTRYKEPLSPQDAPQLADCAGIEPMRRSAGALGYSIEVNDYGAVVFHCTSELECLCLTQLHTNFEIWGIDAQQLATGRGAMGDRPHIPVKVFEELFTYTLSNYLSAAAKLGIESPLRLECGLTDVRGFGLVVDEHTVTGYLPDRNIIWDTMIDLHDFDTDRCLLPFFENIWRRCGGSRPTSA